MPVPAAIVIPCAFEGYRGPLQRLVSETLGTPDFSHSKTGTLENAERYLLGGVEAY